MAELSYPAEIPDWHFYIFGKKESKIAVLDHRENPFFFLSIMQMILLLLFSAKLAPLGASKRQNIGWEEFKDACLAAQQFALSFYKP